MQISQLNKAILLGLLFVILGTLVASASPIKEDAAQISNLLHLALDEYRLGVKEGHVINQDEYHETQLFLTTAQKKSGQLSGFQGQEALQMEIHHLQLLVKQKEASDRLSPSIEKADAILEKIAGVSLKEFPPHTPSSQTGQQIYQNHCLACHGEQGNGNGPQANGLNPPPTRFQNTDLLTTRSPYGLYRTLSTGVEGTAMVSWKDKLDIQARWDVLTYISRLPYPVEHHAIDCKTCIQQIKEAGFNMADVATRNDAELQAMIAHQLKQKGRQASEQDLALLIGVVRNENLPPPSGGQTAKTQAVIFSDIRGLLNDSRGAFERGENQVAADHILESYLIFEGIEKELATRNKALMTRLEGNFNLLKGHYANQADISVINPLLSKIQDDLKLAEQHLVEDVNQNPLWNFTQAVIILMREGFEAMIIIAALIALTKKARFDLLKGIYSGVALGVLASILTAVLLEMVFHAQSQELLEGLTILVAAAMLFYVSYWMIDKVPLQKWNTFIYGKLRGGLDRGSALTIMGVSFCAVYREGFETILFYKALFLSSPGQGPVIVGGILAAIAGLTVLYFVIYKLSIKIPMKQFFLASSLLLYALALIFVGKGIHELQEGGLLSTTPIAFFDFSALGVYPTLETIVGQLALVFAFLVVLGMVFLKPLQKAHQVVPSE